MVASPTQSALEGALAELRTIWMVEETVAPKSYARLRPLLDEDQREVLDTVASATPRTLLRLDHVIREWERRTGRGPRQEVHHEALDVEELIGSLADLKRSEAEVLERAAEAAPERELADELQQIAREERALAESLERLSE